MSYEPGSAAALVEAMRDSRGGWWSAVSCRDLLALYTVTDDTYYRAHYMYANRETDGNSFPLARPAYVLGHVAGLDPEYAGRSWDDVEPELVRSWLTVTERPWETVSDFARAAFTRSSSAKADTLRTRLANSSATWNAA